MNGFLISILALIACELLFLFLYYENNHLKQSKLSFVVPELKHPLLIVHLSDVHTKRFGKNNGRLLSVVQNMHPDLIFITGDLLDRHKPDLSQTATLCSSLEKIAPSYYCPGNHDYSLVNREAMFRSISNTGIEVLRHRSTICPFDSSIKILGLDLLGYEQFTPKTLSDFEQQPGVKLVLSHYPQVFPSLYSNYNIHAVFCGHAHGGQVRLPFIGGLYAPTQGLFPKYTKGLYEKNGVNMVVSRGLGNSSRFPFRIWNRPEVILITLQPKEAENG